MSNPNYFGRRRFENLGYHMPRTLERYEAELAFLLECPGLHGDRCLTGMCETQANRTRAVLERHARIMGRSRWFWVKARARRLISTLLRLLAG